MPLPSNQLLLCQKADYSKIHEKGDTKGFSYEDTKAIFCLEILRLELSLTHEISDKSWGAFSIVSAWSNHYYKTIENQIYEEIQAIHKDISKLNKNKYKGDIKSPTGNNPDDWANFFKTAIKVLLQNVK